MSVTIRKAAKASKAKAELLDIAEDVFREHSDPFGMSWRDLAGKINQRLTVGEKPPSPSTIERRIAEMKKAGVIKKTEAGAYKLASI